LCDWAEHELSLLQTDDKGITQREHLEQVRKMTGHAPEELENPYEFPKLLSHVWSFFLQLSQARTQGFSGPNPISYPDIQSWKELTGNTINPYEVGILKRLDAIYLSSTRK